MSINKRNVLVICGPTGTGKTQLAINLLHQVKGEIISADSRQVYQGVDYGTNKLSFKKNESVQKETGHWVQEGVRINNYDVIAANQTYDVSRFIEDSLNHLERIWNRGGLPVIVGGTGFYIDSFVGISPISRVEPDQSFRSSVSSQSLNTLQQRLAECDPRTFSLMSNSEKNNKTRLIRYLEMITKAGSIENATSWSPLKYQIDIGMLNVLYVGLTASRDYLYSRADTWVDSLLLSRHLKDEVTYLRSLNGTVTLLKSMIYQPYFQYMLSQINQAQVIDIIKGQMHQYIRRQLTWFKRRSIINWFDVSSATYHDEVFKCIYDNIPTLR
ncbi:tRNA (adenosine(37)-N6)-dimethylallyltransferase MiaA [candidate division WWE3 bacterium]|nr:tRNA (adenosine(37)-N6)-dimethylallyltransferase MiaA [candidate division WWE3 bacterium]